jgi:hypothetical protein
MEVRPMPLPADPPEGAAPAPDPDAEAFYRRIEQAGQLADVAEDADVSSLPPRITHVRYPDGRVERVGFS